MVESIAGDRAGEPPNGRDRGVSHVLGVAVLLGVTVLAVGGLAAGVGGLIESQAASADAQRVADQIDDAIQPVGTTGHHSGRVSFTGGHLGTEPRSVRVLVDGTVVERIDAGALVFEADERRVAYVGGALVRGDDRNNWLVDPPGVTASRDGGTVMIGVPRLGDEHAGVSGEGGVSATLETNVSHERTVLGSGTVGVAIETETPAAFGRHFDGRGARTARRAFAGDDHPSVVVTYPGDREGYLVVHDLSLEVGNG